jgi:hypothetical protein
MNIAEIPPLRSGRQTAGRAAGRGRARASLVVNGRIEEYLGGDTVSTEVVASRRHAGAHPPVTGWKLELPTTTWHLLLN